MKKEHSKEIIKNIRKALLLWYPFKEGSRILFVGEKDEDWISGIDCLGASMDFKSVFELVNEDYAPSETYDYIIMIEKLELEENPTSVLKWIKEILSDSGVLLLGMNNRFGLRYFCGDRDKYTGRNFDGVENYKRAYRKKEDSFAGRMYAKSEIRELLEKTGFCHNKFFSVLPDLYNPNLILSELYTTNEDLCNRVFPMYESPETIFLEEETLYTSLIENGMFHDMANAFLVECRMDENFSDVCQVTSSLERDESDAFLTMIREAEGEKFVEKRPAFAAGKQRLVEIISNHAYLREHGIQTVDGKLCGDSYIMPFVDAEVGQLHLKKLLLEGKKDEFIREMDHFRDLIIKASSEKILFDMVPLNSFYMDGEFAFFDQEFAETGPLVELLFFRLVASFYYESPECEKIIPREVMFERYGILEKAEELRKQEFKILDSLRNEKALHFYHREHRRNGDIVNSNRQRMNYSQENYEKLFVNIFDQADSRKLILFGSGNFTKRFISIYGKDYDIYAIVDNNPSRWGDEIQGIKIRSPEILKDFAVGEFKLIICIKSYLAVMRQLDEMGIGGYSIYDWNRSYPKKRKRIESQSEDKVAIEPKKYHIGYVAGAFDMFHVGHLNLLRRAKEQCDYLIVGVIADETIYELKNKYPVIPIEDRVDIVGACRYVDQAEALPANFNGIKEAYKMFQFDVQFSGNDHKDNPLWLADKEYLEKNGADIVFFDYTEKVSSTKLRQTLERN